MTNALSIKTEEEITPTATNTRQPTGTPEPTGTPQPTGTPKPTLTASPTPMDIYENDAKKMPGYAGPQRRTFSISGDVDYVRYHMKANTQVWFETTDLSGAADTELVIHRDDDGVLNGLDPLLATDDDSGDGLGSRTTLEVLSDMWVTIMIRNRGSAWGDQVGYTLGIITEEEVTPTITVTASVTGTPGPTRTSSPTGTPTQTSTPKPTLTASPTPSDQYENDTPPHVAMYAGPQRRTFAPSGDVDYVQYFMKAGLRTWFETKSLSPATDTKITLFCDHNDNRILDEGDLWLAEDDDSGAGLASYVSYELQEDAWVVAIIENRGAAWGPTSQYTLEIITAEEVTPTVPPKPQKEPTRPSTQAPTQAPAPALRPPTQAPNPAPARPPTQVPNPAPIPIPRQVPAPPPAPTSVPSPTSTPSESETIIIQPDLTNATLKVSIFMDINQDSIMNWGEQIDDVLVNLTTASRTWETEAYTVGGEALIPLAGAPTGQELIVLIPYLHRSGVIKLKAEETSQITSQIDLTMPTLPSYLP